MMAKTPPVADTTENSQPVTPEDRVDDVEKRDLSPDDESTGHEREYVTGIARWLILGPVTLAYFTFFLDLAVLSTAAPAITSEFNSLIDIGWYDVFSLKKPLLVHFPPY